MPKFSTRQERANVTAPVKTTGTMPTHEGGAGYSRDAKSELFLLAVTNMVREDTFYEDGGTRDDRFTALIHQVTGEDPAWIAGFRALISATPCRCAPLRSSWPPST